MKLTTSALVRNAFGPQQLLLSRLFRLERSAGRPQRLVVKIQVWRLLLRARDPVLGVLVLALGLINLPSYRAGPGVKLATSAPGKSPRNRKSWFPKSSTSLFLPSLSGRDRAGKL